MKPWERSAADWGGLDRAHGAIAGGSWRCGHRPGYANGAQECEIVASRLPSSRSQA
jgi:hypothetical protein